jgi:hypothetical protein
MKPIHALWAVPRSASTAFERMCIERGDVTVLHEPFSATYYYGPAPGNPRYAGDARAGDPDSAFAAVLERVLGLAERGPVLFKDMAYHAAPYAGPEFLHHFANTFLIRHPRLTLRSLHARAPDFTSDEAGFSALERFYDAECARAGRPPPVLDANDVCADPAALVRAWCAAVALPFDPAALTWSPGSLPEWSLWEPWHDEVARTTEFAPPRDPMAEELPDAPAVHACYQRCLAIYERMYAARLRPLD